VLADPGRLRQIVANLVTNAHLYTPDGGEITVTVTPEAENVRIAVTDTGRGMPQEQLDRVFERFYRATEDRASPGTGLGLSIVKSLVALHDGGIEVRSRPGAGTTFAVLLPAIRGATGGPGAIETLRGRHVLVVDDEREVAELIADQLAPFGVRTTVAGGGADALRHLTEQGFDAVTLDVRMPDLNGLEVLHRIRATPGLEQLPIVFVSASGDRDKLAGEWLVSKPIDADELRAVLSEAVRAGRSRALVVAREELAPRLEPALTALGVEHNWEVSGIAAARACTEHRFEIALVDVGLPNPQAVLQAISLRGRRDRRAVVLFTDGAAPIPPQIERLGLEVISIEQAAGRVRSVLAPEPAEPTARER
jgi:CheY-like chemotaxis protein